MKGKIIGIVPKANNLFSTDFYNEDIYAFVDNYGKRIAQAGGVPIGVVPVDAGSKEADGYAGLEQQLELCNGFLFSGGGRIWPYHIRVMDYAYRTGKKVLGICMGMQVLHAYFLLRDEAAGRGIENCSADQLLEIYDEMKKARYMFVEPVPHHWDINPTVEHMQEAKHFVEIKGISNTSRVLGFDDAHRFKAVTMHRYRVIDPSQQLAVTMLADDGTIEGLEYGRNIIGVQFHPEAEMELMSLFKWLAD